MQWTPGNGILNCYFYKKTFKLNPDVEKESKCKKDFGP
jgi:hypothetical protein